MRVKIRNTTYETVRVAAKALGVSTNAIYAALENDTIDRVGMRYRNGGHEVTLFGVTYPSITHCAEALGVQRSSLSLTLTTLNKLNVAPETLIRKENK